MSEVDELPAALADARSGVAFGTSLPDETYAVPLPTMLEGIAAHARRSLPATPVVSISLADRRRVTATETPQWADPLEALYLACTGPASDAAKRGYCVIGDVAADTRWRECSEAATAVGIRSLLAVPLIGPSGHIGTLTAFGHRSHAYGSAALAEARAFARYAALATSLAALQHESARLAQQAQEALSSRAMIEQAKGIVMAERDCSPDEAFSLLTVVARRMSRKLRDVADAVVRREDNLAPLQAVMDQAASNLKHPTPSARGRTT
jgi:GAF domain-containing protein